MPSPGKTYFRVRKGHTLLESWIERLKEVQMEKEGRHPKMVQAKKWVIASIQCSNVLQSITWPLKKEKSLQRLSQFTLCTFPMNILEYCRGGPCWTAVHSFIQLFIHLTNIYSASTMCIAQCEGQWWITYGTSYYGTSIVKLLPKVRSDPNWCS